ncbi:ATP-binding protein [Cereibacter sp. SYSU M97828]|nr:ATP-binding protein [Cereibacter flavus]
MPRDNVASSDGAYPGPHWTHMATRGLLTAGLQEVLLEEGASTTSINSIFEIAEAPDLQAPLPNARISKIMDEAQAKYGNRPFWPMVADLEDVVVPTSDRLLVLAQLSRILQSEEGLEAMLRPRALMAIDGALDGVAFKWTFEKALVPGLKVVDMTSKNYGPRTLMAADLANCNAEGKSRGSRSEWNDVLATRNPVVLRVLPGERVPQSLKLCGAKRVQLPSPDQATAIWMMCVIFADADPQELARAVQQLPGDQALASVTTEDLLAAFRSATPEDVVAALNMACMPRSSSKGLKLNELVGYGQAKGAALEIVDDLAAWGRGELSWEDVCRGVIFHGPPGVGKTTLARAMASQHDLNFVSTSYADMQKNGHLGDMLKAMDLAFRDAVANRPSILFIDEISAFSSRSGGGGSLASYDQKVIAGLLEKLDGIEDREGVVVIGACNDLEALDPAVRRAGRFDREIHIGLPQIEEIPQIFRQHLRGDLATSDLHEIAVHALGKSGAECAGAVRNARRAARHKKRPLLEEDLARELGAYGGAWPKDFLTSTACHEAGHAIVAVALDIGTPLSIRITQNGGVCTTDRKVRLETKKYLHQQRTLDLAGRAAERLMLGSISTGSGGSSASDIALATRRIIDEELSSGLGSSGPLYYGPAPNISVAGLSSELQAMLRQRLLDAEEDAFSILRVNRRLLGDMTRDLVSDKILIGGKLDAFLSQVVKE